LFSSRVADCLRTSDTYLLSSSLKNQELSLYAN
jgi:hypothetical protein